MTDSNLNRAQTFLGSAIIFMGIMGLLGWVTGLRVLASLHPDFIPMAAGTSLSFLALGSVLLIDLPKQKKWKRKIVSFIVGTISIYGFLNFLEYVSDVHLTLTNIVFPTTERLRGFLVDRMSPVTGGLFFLSGLALEMRIWGNKGKGVTNVITGVGLLTLSIGFVATLGYLYGTPLLYGSKIIPLAATTSLCFLLLGAGFILMLGSENVFLKYIVGDSPRAQLLRGLIPTIVLAFLLDGFLDARVFSRLNLSGPLTSGLESIVFAVIVGALAVRISHTIFRNASVQKKLCARVKNVSAACSKMLRSASTALHPTDESC